jgi:hypothetical protein
VRGQNDVLVMLAALSTQIDERFENINDRIDRLKNLHAAEVNFLKYQIQQLQKDLSKTNKELESVSRTAHGY